MCGNVLSFKVITEIKDDIVDMNSKSKNSQKNSSNKSSTSTYIDQNINFYFGEGKDINKSDSKNSKSDSLQEQYNKEFRNIQQQTTLLNRNSNEQFPFYEHEGIKYKFTKTKENENTYNILINNPENDRLIKAKVTYENTYTYYDFYYHQDTCFNYIDVSDIDKIDAVNEFEHIENWPDDVKEKAEKIIRDKGLKKFYAYKCNLTSYKKMFNYFICTNQELYGSFYLEEFQKINFDGLDINFSWFKVIEGYLFFGFSDGKIYYTNIDSFISDFKDGKRIYFFSIGFEWKESYGHISSIQSTNDISKIIAITPNGKKLLEIKLKLN